MIRLSLILSAAAGLASAQLPPTPEGLTVVDSKHHPGVTISFKEPGICETTPNVKSYAGHVRLPSGYLDDAASDYPVNTFFWFFEAREDPENAPLAIWLNGGPGGSSMMGVFAENGPCLVNRDSSTTRLNPWSWNNKVNMLYIDEPVQVGFSYDEPTNCTVDLNTERPFPVPADFSDGIPTTNLTNMVGVFSSQNTSQTANSTEFAAHALWHFAQVFFSEFPHYKPADDRISVWAESYGGHYGPGFMQFFQQQNEKIKDGTIEQEHAHYLHLDTLGIVNGLMDVMVQSEAYVTFPYNNTWGIQVYNKTVYDELMHNYTKHGGCKDQYAACQANLRKASKQQTHRLTSSDQICHFETWCQEPAEAIYNSRDYGWLDIIHPSAEPFPPPYSKGYLTQSTVLQAIGSPVNYTSSSVTVSKAFTATFDEYVGGLLDAMAYLLDSGVKVHMMYGDRDYACNWVGGEAASLAVPYSGLEEFSKAGYADMLSGGQLKGLTRQYGNYSFTRVFDAGHLVPAYQPQAAYDIFMRALFNEDIATGEHKVTDGYTTEGPDNTWHVQQTPPKKKTKAECYILSPGSCTKEEWELVKSGKAKIKDFLLQGEEDDENEEL